MIAVVPETLDGFTTTNENYSDAALFHPFASHLKPVTLSMAGGVLPFGLNSCVSFQNILMYCCSTSGHGKSRMQLSNVRKEIHF